MQSKFKLIENAINLLEEAKSQFYIENVYEAKQVSIEKFTRGIQLLLQCNKQEKNEQIKSLVKQKIEELSQEFDKMKIELEIMLQNQHCNINFNQKEKKYNILKQDTLNQQNQSSLIIDQDQSNKKIYNKHIILEKVSSIHFEDIYGFNSIKNVFKESIIIPKQFSNIFQGKLTPYVGVLLFGPAGSGKSVLVQWCCSQIQGTLLRISFKDLFERNQRESKWLTHQLFEKARQNKPSIIYIKYIDSIITDTQNENERQYFQNAQQQLLIEISQNKQINQVFIIGSSNSPWSLTPIFIKSFQKRIYVPLPNFQERFEIIINLMNKLPNNFDKENFLSLTQMTEGYSRSEIFLLQKKVEEQRNGNLTKLFGIDEFILILKFFERSIKHEDLQKYEYWNSEFSNA